jgi:hypothetical protein
MAIQQETQETEETQEATKARSLHVRVIERANGEHPVVNVTIPVRVAKFGIKMAKKFSGHAKDLDLDWDAVTEMIEDGQVGKIVEVEDVKERRTVEVWVD